MTKKAKELSPYTMSSEAKLAIIHDAVSWTEYILTRVISRYGQAMSPAQREELTRAQAILLDLSIQGMIKDE